MKNKKENQNQDLNQDENVTQNGGKGYGYTSFCLALISVIFVPLMYLIGIYALCASVLFALASLAFFNSQKTRGLFTLAKAARILAYVALILCLIVLIGAIIYSAL